MELRQHTSTRYLLIFLLSVWMLIFVWTFTDTVYSAEHITKHAPVVRIELVYDLPKKEAEKLCSVFRQEGFWATIGEKKDIPGLYKVSLGTFRSPSLARQLAEGISNRLTLSTMVAPALSHDVKYPKPKAFPTYWTLEISVFSVRKKALKLRDHWRSLGYPYYVVHQTDSNGASWWCVRVGLFSNKLTAQRTANLFDQEQGKPLIPLEVSHTSLTSGAEGELPDYLLLATGSTEATVPTPQLKTKPLPKLAAQRPDAPPALTEQQKRKKTVQKPQKATTAQSTRKTVPTIPETFWTLHIAAFSQKKNALSYRDHWRTKGYPSYVVKLRNNKGKAWWMTRIGTYKVKATARKAAKDFTRREKKKIFLRSLTRDLYKRRLVP